MAPAMATSDRPTPSASARSIPVEELDRRLRWPVVSLVVFLGLILGLGAVAALSLLAPIRIIGGLPDDPDAQAALSLVRGRFPIGSGVLRFGSALTGEARPGWPYSREAAAAASQAEALLERARRRATFDPRLIAALGHLDLGRRQLARAERRYRAALDLGHHYGEAHLGLGVALALRSEVEVNSLDQRALRLAALAQFVAVRESDPAYRDALYDRALMLDLVGRHEEARRIAAAYLARDPASAWAAALAARLEMARP